MIKRFTTPLYLIFLLPLLLSAHNQTTTGLLDNKNNNAISIVRNFEAVFSQSDANNATYRVKKTITIFNKQGEEYGNFYSYSDKFRELKDFSGIVKDASGKVIKKISKKDLTTSSYSENHLALGIFRILYEYKSPVYPYTVEYTYQEKWKNGIINYPPFMPIAGYMQEVEKANYTIELPANMSLRYHPNFACDIKDETVNGKRMYSFSAQDLKAMLYEPLSAPFRQIVPTVLIAPSDFCYDSHCGNMSNWNNYGNWVSNLLKGRDVLPPDMTSKLQELTKDAKSEREKVSILYKYLQNNSRYVSIQLGIGGFQPIEASSVLKTGFGDCKGLSNAMKAMLNSIGIKSNYCEISMKEKDLYSDFTNVSQTDHAILLVPLDGDSIWLECTSQTLPFGYIHDDIAGHDAVIITDDGGKLCKLPKYQDTENNKQSSVTLDIEENGSIRGKITFTENLHGYASNVYKMTSNDREHVISYINQSMKLPKITVDNIAVSENKSALPSCTLKADFNVSDFANKTGTRLFIPISPLNKGNYNIFSSNTRNSDIQIYNGFSESDSVTINIPELYKVESLPKEVSLSTPFGTLSTKIMQNDRTITYIQQIEILSGKYDKSKYNEIKTFFASISSATKNKIVIRKQE